MFREMMLCAALCLGGLAAGAGEPPPTPTPEAPLAGVVTAGRLNVRLRPDKSAPVLGQLTRDARVVVRRVAAGWCEIDMPPTFGVWISETVALTDGDAASLAEGESLEATVLKSGARLRSTPSLRGAVIGERAKGVKLVVLRAFNGWLRVVAPADMRAYIHADYVDLRGPAGQMETASLSSGGTTAPGLPATARPGPVPESAARRIALAEDILSDEKCALEETRRALRMLEESLSLEGVSDVEGERVRKRVRAVLGGLRPSRWLELFDEAEALHEREIEALDRRYAEPLREARKDLDEAEPLEHTARGTLLAPAPGSETYRLVHGDTLLFDIDTGGRDLTLFVGKRVGVIGPTRESGRPGGVPGIAVTYVEEIAPEDPGGL